MKKLSVREMCLYGVMTALYVVTTMINPLGYGVIQLRISAMISLIPFFDKRFKIPCILGVAIANLTSPLGIIDILAGVMLWTIAYYVVDPIIKNIWIKSGAVALLSGLIIGGALTIALHIPFTMTAISLTISQAIVFSFGILVVKVLIQKGLIKEGE